MGRVAICTVISGRQRAPGKARLESTEVEFSGRFRLKIPLADVTSVEAESGELRIQYFGKAVTFLLGADAGKWAERLRSPRTVLDKLGVKPGQRVALIAVPDSDLRRQLVTRGAAVVDRLPRQPVDVVSLERAHRVICSGRRACAARLHQRPQSGCQMNRRSRGQIPFSETFHPRPT